MIGNKNFKKIENAIIASKYYREYPTSLKERYQVDKSALAKDLGVSLLVLGAHLKKGGRMNAKFANLLVEFLNKNCGSNIKLTQ